jgi:uncharacterized membrane protein
MAVGAWSLMGVLGIPLFVLLDHFGGWQWQPHNAIYDQMIVSIYFVLGICCLFALRQPLQHSLFLWFVVWSSVAHGAVMLFHAASMPLHRGHLLGDVWILAGAVSLGFPLWRAQRAVEPAHQT